MHFNILDIDSTWIDHTVLKKSDSSVLSTPAAQLSSSRSSSVFPSSRRLQPDFPRVELVASTHTVSFNICQHMIYLSQGLDVRGGHDFRVPHVPLSRFQDKILQQRHREAAAYGCSKGGGDGAQQLFSCLKTHWGCNLFSTETLWRDDFSRRQSGWFHVIELWCFGFLCEVKVIKCEKF